MWNPETHPYRVLATYRSRNPLHYGWRDGKPCTFSTEQEAREFAATIKGAKSVRIHKAANAATWQRNGRWEKV